MASRTHGRAARRGALAVATALGSVLAAVSVPAGATAAIATGATSGQVTITGSGFGHGVGLSQYGALGMARAGSTVAQIIGHYYSGVAVAPFRDAVDVRVNVVHAGSTVTLRSTARAAGGGGLRLLPDGATPVSLAAGDVAVLRPSGGRITVSVTRAAGGTTSVSAKGLEVRWPGTRLLAGAATTVDVTSALGTSRKVRSYRWGSLQITPVGAALDAVAVLDLHAEYLRGVAEMPSSWPAAALQTQAVAARNYALVAARSTPKPSCGGCQLWDDTRSQVYNGWAKESEVVGSTRYGDRWMAAVAATQTSATTGLAVLYQGRPVSTYFASSTGGRTRDPADVWGTSLPYLASVADPWSADPSVNPSYALWTRTVAVTRLLTLFSLPDLASLTVTSRDSGGAARVVTATAADGTRRTLTGNALTSAVGLPGAWITTLTLPMVAPSSPSPSPSASAAATTPTGAGAGLPAGLVPSGLTPVQWQPGEHLVNGRIWNTRCERYSGTAWRCAASIWATTYVQVAGAWTARTAWVTNNIAYFDANPATWTGNPYAIPGERTVAGRRWRTQCSAADPRTCTTWILASPVTRIAVTGGGYRYVALTRWTLNNHVFLGAT